MRTRLILNPYSGKGRTKARLPQITTTLKQLGIEVDAVETTGPGVAVELGRQAVTAGYERVVVAGGDGTCNEVINGLLEVTSPGQTPLLSILPIGSGNDLAFSLGIPPDLEAACALLTTGSERRIDVGRVTVDGRPRLFGNSAGVGLDAEVALEAQKVKHLQGHGVYIWSALRTVAFGRWPYSLQMAFNGTRHQETITLFAVGNGRRIGGGFFLTPEARLDDGLLDVCFASRLSKLQVLNIMPKTFNGSHVGHPAITMARVDRIELLAEGGVPGYIDGEILCANGRHFEFEVIAGALRVWA